MPKRNKSLREARNAERQDNRNINQLDISAKNTRNTGCNASTTKKVGERFKLEFDIERSRRYCLKQLGKYKVLSSLSTILSLVGGSAVVAQAIALTDKGVLTGGLITVIASILCLVFEWQENARLYAGFAIHYTDIKRKLVRDGDNADINFLCSEYLTIEAEEPPPLNVLMIVAHNETCNVMNCKSEKQHLKFWQRFFARFITLPPFIWEK